MQILILTVITAAILGGCCPFGQAPQVENRDAIVSRDVQTALALFTGDKPKPPKDDCEEA